MKIKDVWTRRYTVGHTVAHYSFQDKIFFPSYFILFYVAGEVARRADTKGQGNEWNRNS